LIAVGSSTPRMLTLPNILKYGGTKAVAKISISTNNPEV